MKTADLLRRARTVDPSAALAGAADVDVVDVEDDSRRVRPGSCFAAIVGEHHDGHDHAAAAVERGAVAVLAERGLDVGVPVLRVASTRQAVGPVAAGVHGDPSNELELVGITGTNGKTTTAALVAAVLEAAGRRVEVIGTLTGPRTTPEAAELQRRLRAWADDGVDAVVMEVSSHALDLRRVDGCRFSVAAFLNLSPEHLDHHGTMAAYEAAKARLFTSRLSARAVIQVDDPAGRRIAEAAEIPVDTVTRGDAAGVRLEADGTRFVWRGRPVRLPLVGEFNVDNALVAAAVAEALGLAPDTIVAGLERAGSVPGRVEPVDVGQPFHVLVDYAHTPDALARLLAAVRPLVGEGGRLVVVMGCGGDRDRTKRPLMGRAASDGADVVIVTSDNPRSEDPSAIIAAVLEGVPADRRPAPVVEVDRRGAIERALSSASPGDVVVLAGKGHETTQEIDGVRHPFDDRSEARRALVAMREARGW